MTASGKETTKRDATSQQVAARSQEELGQHIEQEEHYSSANAQASVNLNIFAALSGAFSSKTKKKTKSTPNKDRSTTDRSTEENHSVGHARGVGFANMNAAAAAEAKEGRRNIKQRAEMEGQRMVEARVDHLGIEGPK
ncbi:hypothetical protein P152DRAFT_482657 [Eremomyces bilateralis CBS 781.70]|uniref:Uncharacterized protein n=1 Tax=Eremomyces bilateralis CBS 781.70 TaxID=1392243 RepID=A0A6G1G2G9_9PEZI|nr:uncharacterized protein P152DRAFT_482657 [Eremomyces bilateralis CBS 781.70]KAF1812120.1 hypothetical protein P152DRAFT_482657 [Eremomyces bilateralis CBS 781.70]